MTDKLKQFLNGKFKYDPDGQYIWLVEPNGNHQKIADLRGWGAIQNLFRGNGGKIDLEAAAKLQDELGEYLCSVLNNPTLKENN